jgi:hypothetical protein
MKHVHKWGEWEADLLQHYEYRYCACGSFQARPLVTS